MRYFYIFVVLLFYSGNLFSSRFYEVCMNPEKFPLQFKTVRAILTSIDNENCSEALKFLKVTEHITIIGDKILGIEPIVEFDNLRQLSIDSNFSVSLLGLEKLTNLEVLKLQSPTIFFPEIINNTIKSIKISSNRVNDIKTIKFLKGLERVELDNSNSKIEFLDLSLVSNNSELKTLSLNGFKISNIPSLSVSNLKIEKFKSDNSIIDKPEDLSKINKIKTLVVPNSTIENLEFLSEFKNLDILDISGNSEIKDYSPIKKLESLTMIFISKLNLKNLEFLPRSADIEVIRGEHNQIENIDIVSTYPNIRKIVFHHNKIENIPDLVNTRIQYIWMNNNKLQNLPEMPKSVLGLLVSDNNISDFTNLISIPNVVDLRIANNKIDNINFLLKFSRILFLDISRSNIRDISPIINSKKLRFLIASNNNISDLSAIRNFNSLFTLSISDNDIKDLSVLKNAYNISKFEAENNPLGTTIEKTEENCPTDSKSKAIVEWCSVK